ncbi:ABC transporter permease [Chelatococcus reniformis]|uniref:ABC transporter permease n=1 Tax=Chelatococcus reniformis TaxID=1494448 RepID=A0A916UWU8_9HYPH|nr:ABC transporter permease [Chelatococcus reniformis]GGC92305.1 ABC transporter permease [Chelatococcus reniformis]
MSVSRLAWIAASALVFCVIVAAWQQAADARVFSPVFFPGPDRIWSALHRGWTQGDLAARTATTLGHMLVGWLLASVVGVALGAVIGLSPLASAYLKPTLELLRPLPASATIPVAIALLGLGESMVLAVIAFGAVWPMLVGTMHGVQSVEPRLLEVAHALGMPRRRVIRDIALPSAIPDILAGLRLSLTVALILTAVTEMMAGGDGLGAAILDAGRLMRSANVFAGVAILGLIGMAGAMLLSILEARCLRWRLAS